MKVGDTVIDGAGDRGTILKLALPRARVREASVDVKTVDGETVTLEHGEALEVAGIEQALVAWKTIDGKKAGMKQASWEDLSDLERVK